MYDELYFGYPSSLGDTIVTSPIIRLYAKKSNILYCPAGSASYESVKCLFQDAENIQVIPYDEYMHKYENAKTGSKILPWGFHQVAITRNASNLIEINVCWDRQIYDYFDLPFSLRYTGFKLPEKIEGAQTLYEKLTGCVDDYAIVHKTMHIDNHRFDYDVQPWLDNSVSRVIEIVPGVTNNIFEYIEVLKHAKQIHVISSSLFCFIDSIANQLNAKLFFHDVRKSTIMTINNHFNKSPWNLIYYDVMIDL
jgi:hypothetical protein